MAISETKRSGVESYPYPVKEGQRYINLNPGRLFVQQPLKKERDREAHLNYVAVEFVSVFHFTVLTSTRLKGTRKHL